MAHDHHDHDHDHAHDHADEHGHSHRSLLADEAPLDAANQSLADALKASFRVLKGVMLLLMLAFLVSGSTKVDESEQAVIVRFGQLLPDVRGSGLSIAWPFPIDQTLRIPVKQLKNLQLSIHWPTDETMMTGSGLDPTRDGALLTGDRGLVHVKWNMTYQIENIQNFIKTVADSDVGQQVQLEKLLTGLLQASAVNEASAMQAIDVYPRSPESLATRVRVRMNEVMESMQTGIKIVSLDIPDSSVPAPAKNAFLDVTRQQATRQRLIRQAEQEATSLLNSVAGQVHETLLQKLDELEALKATNAPADKIAAVQAEIDELFEKEVSGDAGASIAQAKAYYTEVVNRMNADIREYETLLPEYQTNPAALLTRIWTSTKRKALDVIGLTKWFLPGGEGNEIRLPLQPDPKQQKEDEKLRLELEAKRQAHERAGDMPPQTSIGRRRRG